MEEVIKSRRSTYPPQFSGEAISKENIVRMLDAARFAPNHRLTQPWRFNVFSGKGKQIFLDAWVEAYRVHAGEGFNHIKAEKFGGKVAQSSHIITIGMHRNPIVPEFEEICAVACAVQNMMLVAENLGVGGYWSTGGLDFYDHLKLSMGLGVEDRLLGFLLLGIPKQMDLPPRERKTIDEFTRWFE